VRRAVGRMFFQILGSIAERTRPDVRTHPRRTHRARTRGRTGGQKPKLGARQARTARQIYDETDQRGRHLYTVAQIAAEFGVTRPTIYRYLDAQSPPPSSHMRGRQRDDHRTTHTRPRHRYSPTEDITVATRSQLAII